MAMFVDIAQTKHLTYSPFNEKHNVLYHRARHNVNQRHVQKPWFDLSPFLDKVGEKDLKLEDYRPEYDVGIQSLQSLSIVEDYFSEKPLMAKEFKIDEFWDFLFSHDWGEGYSIRVLEGRLYQLMISTLVNLTKARSVIQHSTVAYAKNRRRKFSIYKDSEKKPELCSFEETLLLEFIYYGHSTRFLSETSSCGYPKMTEYTTAGSSFGLSSSDLESTDPDAADNHLAHGPELSKKTSKSSKGSKTSDSVTFSEPPIDKSLSRIQEDPSVCRTHVSGINRLLTTSNFSSGSEENDKPVDCDVDLSKFSCSEKVSYLGEFDLSDDSSACSSDEEEARSDFGQMYYLGEKKKIPNLKKSTEEILRSRKEEFRKRWQTRRQVQNLYVKERKPIFPEFSELDVKKYTTEGDSETPAAQKFPTELPDLDGIIEILKRDEREIMLQKRLESRYKTPRKKCSVFVQPSNARFADQVGAVTDSHACRLHCYQSHISWKVMSESSRKKFLDDKALQFAGKTKPPPKRKSLLPEVKKDKLTPLVYITTPNCVTYLHPVSKDLMDIRLEEKRKQERSTRRRAPLASNTTPLYQELIRLRQRSDSRPDYSTMERTIEEGKTRMFPKVRSFISGTESPDSDSDVESDGLDESPFDSKKLNLKYSFERIQRKKAQRKKGNPVKQNIFKILRKYYRMQSILKAFSGPSGTAIPTRRKSSVYGGRGAIVSLIPKRKPPLRKKKHASRLPIIEDEALKPKITPGKLRWFPFLEARRELHPPCDDNDEPLFENYPMDKFRENLERALDEFVVRREVVISDYTAKASVSITFTKKYVFSKSQVPR